MCEIDPKIILMGMIKHAEIEIGIIFGPLQQGSSRFTACV